MNFVKNLIYAFRVWRISRASRTTGEFYSLIGHAIASGQLPPGILESEASDEQA